MIIQIDALTGFVTLRLQNQERATPSITEQAGGLMLELADAPDRGARLASVSAPEVSHLSELPSVLERLSLSHFELNAKNWGRIVEICRELERLDLKLR